MRNFVNRVQLFGTLGKDPEMKTFDSGKKQVSFSMATNQYYRNIDGDKVEITDWHNIIAWGKTADYVSEYLKKGSRVIVEGKLSTRSYEDKEGVTRYVTEIVARDIMNLTPKGATA